MRIVFEKPFGLPGRKASSEESGQHFFGADGDELDGFSDSFGQVGGDFPVGQNFRAGEVIDLILMSFLSQGFGCDGGDVPDVYCADRGGIDGCDEGSVFGNKVAKAEQALHVEVGAEEGVSKAGVFYLLFYNGVVAEEADRGVGICCELGELDDVFYAGVGGQVDEVGLEGLGLFGGVGEEEDFFDAFEDAADGCGVVEVADGDG